MNRRQRRHGFKDNTLQTKRRGGGVLSMHKKRGKKYFVKDGGGDIGGFHAEFYYDGISSFQQVNHVELSKEVDGDSVDLSHDKTSEQIKDGLQQAEEDAGPSEEESRS